MARKLDVAKMSKDELGAYITRKMSKDDLVGLAHTLQDGTYIPFWDAKVPHTQDTPATSPEPEAQPQPGDPPKFLAADTAAQEAWAREHREEWAQGEEPGA